MRIKDIANIHTADSFTCCSFSSFARNRHSFSALLLARLRHFDLSRVAQLELHLADCVHQRRCAGLFETFFH